MHFQIFPLPRSQTLLFNRERKLENAICDFDEKSLKTERFLKFGEKPYITVYINYIFLDIKQKI